MAQQNPQLILDRYKTYYLALEQPSKTNIAKWMTTLDAKGQWPDIDYKNNDKSGWTLNQHLDRIRQMAASWANPKSPYYQKTTVWQSISKGIDHWLAFRYQNPNWWHNEIGVPQYWRDIIILTQNHLSKIQYIGVLELLNQYRLKGTGANLIWSADLAIHYGALTSDRELIKKASDLIANEIKITKNDGIQPDFSYHQHSARLQTYHYGSSFVKDNIRLSWQLRNTEWAFPAEKVNILTNFILEGWQWMARGIHTIPGTLDRSVSRKDYLQSADLKIYLPYLIQLVPAKSIPLKAILIAQIQNKTSVTGFRFYPYSDFTAYQQPGFSFFLKTISTRTMITEQINGENTKGTFLNGGDSYFVKNGNEYENLMPVWDWRKLPGATNFTSAQILEKMPFNGGVGNGSIGFSTMEIKLSNEKSDLTATKFWANYKNVMVCLISGIDLNQDTGKIYTVLDQSRWIGDVNINQPTTILKSGIHQLSNVKWIYHHNFAYFPLDSNSLELNLMSKSGSWSAINASGDKNLITEKVFMPVLYHANHSNAAYAVIAVANAQEAQRKIGHFNWRILSNSKICQAIIFEDTILMATFKEKGTYTLNKLTITVDRPCLLLIEKDKVFAADPLQLGGMLNLKIDTKNYQINLPADGTTVH